VDQPHEHQIQREHALKGVEQRLSDVGGVTADPGGGKGENADEIVDAAVKLLDLIGRVLELDGHAMPMARDDPA
jgi:hypothetical protein